MVTRTSVSQGEVSYSRGSVDIEAALVLDVEHQVSTVQVLHHKEQMFLENIFRGDNFTAHYQYFCFSI